MPRTRHARPPLTGKPLPPSTSSFARQEADLCPQAGKPVPPKGCPCRREDRQARAPTGEARIAIPRHGTSPCRQGQRAASTGYVPPARTAFRRLPARQDIRHSHRAGPEHTRKTLPPNRPSDRQRHVQSLFHNIPSTFALLSATPLMGDLG